MFSPATVILVNCGPRLFKDKRCFRSPASRFVWTCSCSSSPTDKVQFQTAANSQTCYFAMFCFPSPPSHSQPCCSLAGLVLTIGCTEHSSSVFASWRATVLHMGQITWKKCTVDSTYAIACLLQAAPLRSPSHIPVLHWPTWSANAHHNKLQSK